MGLSGSASAAAALHRAERREFVVWASEVSSVGISVCLRSDPTVSAEDQPEERRCIAATAGHGR